jgi:prophage regulatory protein
MEEIISQPFRMIRLPEVTRLTGLRRSSIYSRIKDGVFPRQISLGGKAVAWIEGEVQGWLADRISQCRIQSTPSTLQQAG